METRELNEYIVGDCEIKIVTRVLINFKKKMKTIRSQLIQYKV